jgi:hypothetical protein
MLRALGVIFQLPMGTPRAPVFALMVLQTGQVQFRVASALKVNRYPRLAVECSAGARELRALASAPEQYTLSVGFVGSRVRALTVMP